MMLSEQGKNLSRKLAATILFLSIVPDGRELFDSSTSESVQGFADDGTITCIIDFRNDLYNAQGLPGGFSYEMATNFAAAQELPVRIRVSKKGENSVDSLLQGKADILIRKVEDTLQTSEIVQSISIDRHTIWAVSHERLSDLQEINLWLSIEKGSRRYMNLRNRFYTQYDPFIRLAREVRSPRLSPYDDIIRKHAKHLGWDWRLLAAVMYQESKFAINTFSARGACGLMQVMPNTGAYYGITDLLDPDNNLEAGCRHLGRLQKMFSPEEFTPEERIKFTLAAYNAGEGRIADCRNFAQSRSLDSTKWDEIVKVIPEMRLDSILSEDSVKLGRFRGTETINYVSSIMEIYSAFCQICP